MFERIDSRSPTPLYAQIATRLKVAIASGELRAGDSLPSVRQLASQLRINPATVVQAYRDLEAERLVCTRHGSGTFVLEIPSERRDSDRAAAARRLVHDMLIDAGRLGIPADELRAAIDHELNGRNA
jgi:GntR family transcriptional regulator